MKREKERKKAPNMQVYKILFFDPNYVEGFFATLTYLKRTSQKYIYLILCNFF